MKIGIADCELLAGNNHKFPNLALMKISGYYKAQGHDVELLSSWNSSSQYDKIYAGKVFTSTPYKPAPLPPPHLGIITGGTGFHFDKAPALPEEIEHHMPDYILYRDYIRNLPKTTANQREAYLNTSIGYTTRGCIRGCKFCVNQNSRKSELWSPLEEFVNYDHKYICLNDDNVLANAHCLKIFDELDETGKRWYYKQGLDERLLTEERAKRLSEVHYHGAITFAFDNWDDRSIIIPKMDLLTKHISRQCRFYILVGYKSTGIKDIVEMFERVKSCLERGFLPYIMRYRSKNECPIDNSLYKPIYTEIARWCNAVLPCKSASLSEWLDAGGYFSKQGTIALKQLLIDNPELKPFYHMKFTKR